jgi:hypothetical protein
VSISETEAEGGEDIDAAFLGVALGELAKSGRDKLTLLISPRLAAFGVWLEQLIAESTGKEGKGILPVVDEPRSAAAAYANDRFFVFLQLKGEGNDVLRRELADAGHPVLHLELPDFYALGAQCFLWEMATAVAGSRLGINPFDQPDVEAAKKLARALLAGFKKGGVPPEEPPASPDEGVAVYGDLRTIRPQDALADFLRQVKPGDYIAIQAYLPPTAGNSYALAELRRKIGCKFKQATTLGYGPRFLHSTGQLHKGDAGRGLFIQITAEDARDAAIPDEIGKPDSSLTFGMLKSAQAAGDRQALLNAGRRVIRFHLKKDVEDGLTALMQ